MTGRLLRRLWFKATLYCAAGIVAALVAIWVGPYIPPDVTQKFGARSVDAILSIIASSMLAVTTFSLSTLVSATGAAATGATPRATSLLLEDPTAQRALSTFLGAFLFSLVGIIALNTQLYGDGGRFVLFVATLAVIALIILTLLRWIDHLAGLGHVGETISRVERVATAALRRNRSAPLLGCKPLLNIPDGAIAVRHDRIGYVQHLDVSELQDNAETLDADVYVNLRSGGYCEPARPLAFIVLRDAAQTIDEEAIANLRSAFSIGERRSFDQDPRFGLIALSEIGSRALSPGINDPGTAIDVLATIVRVLVPAPGDDAPTSTVTADRVYLPSLAAEDLIDAALMPISRDGAVMIEVAIRLQKALQAIIAGCDRDLSNAARSFSTVARDRALAALSFDGDRERLEAEFDRLHSCGPASSRLPLRL